MVGKDELKVEDFTDFDEYLEAKRELEEKKRLEFLEDTREKCYKCNPDGGFHYHLLVLRVCQRYNLSTEFIPNVAYAVVNNYMDKAGDVSFEDYINGSSAPLIRPGEEIRKIFPEFDFLKSVNEIVELANNVYDLKLKLVKDGLCGDSYLFSESFSFESFTPVNLDEVKNLKYELNILRKYDSDNKIIQELEDKLMSYNLSKDILELI